MSSAPQRRRLRVVLGLVAGAAIVAGSALTLFPRSGPAAAPPAAAQPGVTALSRSISSAQQKLHNQPDDPVTWAQLGTAYVEQARVTADPSYYPKAQGALERSLQQQPNGNGQALIGMGALANARHDFVGARDWALKAQAALPDTAEVYGVLADAYTQLGETEAATAAVQRMLDLRPGVSSFTRASYELELHGRTDDSRTALNRALEDSVSPSDVAFCRYYLGELAFNGGDLAEADQQYDQGLLADPHNVALSQGKAKTAAAHGDLDQAIAGYRAIVARVPLAQYVQEYAQLLTAAGRGDEATQQYAVLDGQQELLTAAGATDDLSASSVAADRGDAVEALRRAEAEWGRRHNVLVADAYAWALHLNGRDAEAIGYADRAAALGGHNATFSFHRGMILSALGRRDDAATALDEALRTNPYFSTAHAPQARQTLSELRSGR